MKNNEAKLRAEIAHYKGWRESEIDTIGHVSRRTSNAIRSRQRKLSKLLEKQNDIIKIKNAKDRVKELAAMTKVQLMTIQRKNTQGRKFDETDAPKSWLIYEIIRREYSEAIAAKTATKDKIFRHETNN